MTLETFSIQLLQKVITFHQQELSSSKLPELSSFVSNEFPLGSDSLNKTWKISPLVRQAIVNCWVKLVSETFNESTSESEALLVTALEWMTTRLTASEIHGTEDLYSRIQIFQETRRLKELLSAIDETSRLAPAIFTLLQYEHLQDFILVISVDLKEWIQNHPLVEISTSELITEILALPMSKPKSAVSQFIVTSIMTETSRVNFLECILTVFHVFRSQLKSNIHGTSSDEVVFFLPSISRGKGYSSTVGTVEARTMWLFTLLNDALSPKMVLPSSIISRLNDLVDDIDMLEFPTLSPLCERLRTVLLNKSSTSGPALPLSTNPVPKAIAKLTRTKKDESESLVTSKSASAKFFGLTLLNESELLASFEGIWLQIDADPDRLVMSTTVNVQEAALDETHISCAAGILQVTQQTLIWWGLESESNSVTANFYPALIIKYSSILRFAMGKVIDASALAYAPHTLHQMQKRENTMNMRVHFLHVFTEDTVFRFYPIYDNEIVRLTTLLKHLMGRDPFRESQLVKYLIAKRLEATRYRLFKHVLVFSPWIEHTSDLIKVIRKLTKEAEPQGLFDIERLYHSCRVESEVTKETIHHLRIVWHSSQSELVRLKILSIVDRLLDPSVIHVTDPNFELLTKWLQHLEETVSPYKSAEALRIIMVLLSRCRAIQIDPLAPIFQAHTTFDNLKEYMTYCKYFL